LRGARDEPDEKREGPDGGGSHGSEFRRNRARPALVYTDRDMGKLARAGFLLLALPAVVRGAARVTWLARRLPLDELAVRLRTTRRFALPALARPAWLLATVDRLLPLLPPRDCGRCLKRSLLLLDLWSRCGLQPRLHLGAPLVRAGGRHEGHAWVTAEPPVELHAGTTNLGTSSEGYAEAFVL